MRLLPEESRVFEREPESVPMHGHQIIVYYAEADVVRVMLESDAWLSANYMPRVSERHWPASVRRGRGVPSAVPTWRQIQLVASEMAALHPEVPHSDLLWAGKRIAKMIEELAAVRLDPEEMVRLARERRSRPTGANSSE